MNLNYNAFILGALAITAIYGSNIFHCVLCRSNRADPLMGSPQVILPSPQKTGRGRSTRANVLTKNRLKMRHGRESRDMSTIEAVNNN